MLEAMTAMDSCTKDNREIQLEVLEWARYSYNNSIKHSNMWHPIAEACRKFSIIKMVRREHRYYRLPRVEPIMI
jgi:hypothetical protein